MIVTPVEGIQGTASLTAMVATVQAILGELTDAEAGRAAGRVQQAWNDLDLMDDQP
ncbi:hypothetical protein ACIGXQ_37460 [Streptomyces anulatus]